MKHPPPRTGEVWHADLDPVRGSEQGRHRPVVVFQNPALAFRTTTFLSIPLTTNLARKGLEGTCFVPAGEGGLSKDSLALAFHARAIDRTRLTKKFGILEDETVRAIGEAILSAFGISVEA